MSRGDVALVEGGGDVVGLDQVVGDGHRVPPVGIDRLAVDGRLAQRPRFVVPDDAGTADVAAKAVGVVLVVVAERHRDERLPEAVARQFDDGEVVLVRRQVVELGDRHVAGQRRSGTDRAGRTERHVGAGPPAERVGDQITDPALGDGRGFFGPFDRMFDGRDDLVETVLGHAFAQSLGQDVVDVAVVDLVDRHRRCAAERDLRDVGAGPSRPHDRRPVDHVGVDVVDVPAEHRVNVGLAGDPRVAAPAV